ncbi:hypothetical protein PX554_24930 [Sphingomonas sp. H39-1-10]|uniref:hypothetical protein n=1 Tax=Sphingomonas pollutisoli TaxID=3030829 RepID=UPI0023B8FF3D|nr:hypothetical protein [Sphingomonas pollutisoli]MDF0491365.1 hypothetical protein [Sphingomonas pollutisoli]
MKHARIGHFDDTMLLLGRLDGRLHSSTCADIFLARSRLEGAVALAGLAGVPIDVRSLQDWIAGRSPPPRAPEGLNDPISVAAVFHLAISRDEDTRDPVLRATLNVLRSVLDDRIEAEAYGRDDLAHFGPMWRTIREAADAPLSPPGLFGIAKRVFELSALTETGQEAGYEVVTIDGRSWDLPPRARDRNWLIATTVPRLLQQARLTTRVIPSLILLPKFLPPSPASLAETMMTALHKAVDSALLDLDRIERSIAAARSSDVTKRSKAPLLSRLLMSYPGLQPRAVATLLNVTPQGARKLLASAGERMIV